MSNFGPRRPRILILVGHQPAILGRCGPKSVWPKPNSRCWFCRNQIYAKCVHRPFGKIFVLLQPFFKRNQGVGHAAADRRGPKPNCNPAMRKASDAGHIGPNGMRRCLIALAIWGCAMCRRPPRKQKNGPFLKNARYA